jgi:6-phosphogluconolactonase
MKYELIQSESAAGLAKRAAADWLSRLEERSKKVDNVPYNVALSGGRITKIFFEEIVKQTKSRPNGAVGIFGNVHFYWADERCVPPTDAESNYKLAREALFEPLKIPEGRIHRVRGEGPEGQALAEVTSELCRLAPSSNGQPVLDMVFLGMGEDGHTASLFPGEPENVMNDPAVYRAVTAVKPPPRRITLGYAAIAAAREVCVLISGGGKEQALKGSLPPESRTPLARVMSLRAHTQIFTDVDWSISS